MTEKLYYKDPYIKTFEAAVVQRGEETDGRPYVVLDRTAFYPTGGGQPGDTGEIDGISVTGTETVAGEIRHYLERPLPEGRDRVTGRIDWERRFDHMQQHAGQHILSAAFADELGMKTVAFHLGHDDVTIDLATDALTEEDVRRAEAIANRIVYQNIPIQTKWVDGDEWTKYPLRKPPRVKENIRLVIIENYDYNACGGTHPRATAEVGPIHVLSWEKNQDGFRVHFICGLRAVRAFADKHRVIRALNRKLSSQENELPEKLDQLLERYHQLEKQCEEANDRLLSYEAKELLARADDRGSVRLVARSFIDREVADCQKLVRLLVDADESVIVLFAIKQRGRLHVIGARGRGVDWDIRDLVRDGLALINGRGGGKPDRAQGGAETDLTAEGMLTHLKRLFEARWKETAASAR